MVFWMHYALPAFLELHLPLFVTAVAALVVYGTTAVTEVFRSGIMAVSLALAWCAERLRRRIVRRMGLGIGL